MRAGSQPPAPGPLLWDMSTKMEGPGVREEMRTARWFSTSFRPPFISSWFAYISTSFPPWTPGFCYLRFSPFDVIFSLRTLCFFERAQRFPASVGNPLFFRAIAMTFKASYLSLIQISRSLGLYFFSGGGGSCRRQGKSAAPWPAWRAAR